MLEVNQNHKKIHFEKLKKPLERFSISLLGTTMAISLYTGAMPQKVYAADEVESASIEVDSSLDVVDVPESIHGSICSSVGKRYDEEITKRDLEQIDWLYLPLRSDMDVSFLQYCTNLKSLTVTLQSSDYSILKNLEIAPNLEYLFIGGVFTSFGEKFSRSDLEFLENMSSVKSLSLGLIGVDSGCEDILNQLEEISFVNSESFDLDYSKLTNVKRLDFSSIEPYTLAIFLNYAEYQNLIQHGVEVVFESERQKNTYLEVSRKLDDMVSSLDIQDTDTDEEKLNKVLIYVLEHLEYDEEVSRALADGREHSDLTQSFYEDGRLYAVFEKDSAICGNYAALVEALFDRITDPRNSAFVNNDSHAWNVVKVDGEYYLVDATWLDGQRKMKEVRREEFDADAGTSTIHISFEVTEASELLREGRGHELLWYMEKLDDDYIASIDERDSHKNGNVPQYMLDEIESQKDALAEHEGTISDDVEIPLSIDEEEVIDLEGEKVKIKIGKKEMIIGAGALVGVLSATGGAILIHNRKEEEKRRRRMSSMNYHSPYSSSHSPYSSYPSSSNYRRRY